MLDMPLTDIPGPEICRRVRAASADIVVLGITSYSLDHYRQLAIDAGAQGLIAKSVTPKELAEAMRNVLVRPFPGFPDHGTGTWVDSVGIGATAPDTVEAGA